MKRLYLDLDTIEKGQAALQSNMDVHGIDWKFDTIIYDCGGDVLQTWNAIKEADEIYFDSSLINSYLSIGSANLFNMLMKRAIVENIKGKKLYIFREGKDVRWWALQKKLVDVCFSNDINELYVTVEPEGDTLERYYFKKVNIDEILNECEDGDDD